MLPPCTSRLLLAGPLFALFALLTPRASMALCTAVMAATGDIELTTLG